MFCFVIFWIWWVPPGTSENRPHRTSASSRSDARDTRRFVGAVLPSCDSQDQLIKLARYRWITGGSTISTETLLGKFVTLLSRYLQNIFQISDKFARKTSFRVECRNSKSLAPPSWRPSATCRPHHPHQMRRGLHPASWRSEIHFQPAGIFRLTPEGYLIAGHLRCDTECSSAVDPQRPGIGCFWQLINLHIAQGLVMSHHELVGIDWVF